MADRLNGQNIHFLKLQTSIFCVQCEVISENNTPFCFSCGSQAVLSLSRVLGGSLRGQQTTQRIHDAELDRMVGELLKTVPDPMAENRVQNFSPPESFARHARDLMSGRSAEEMRILTEGKDSKSKSQSPETLPLEINSSAIDLEPAINVIAEHAQALTGATGAAIALRHGDEIICRARTGRTAPDLGVRLQTDTGISADCVRTGEIMLCNDAEKNPMVDIESCRRLGARSILVAPLRSLNNTLGVFEVLSRVPNAFSNYDVATMRRMSGMMVAALSRLSHLRPTIKRHPALKNRA